MISTSFSASLPHRGTSQASPSSRQHLCRAISIAMIVVALAPVASGQNLSDVSEGEKLFAIHIKPLLAEKCLACHGADSNDIQGGLNLTSREAMLKGGENFESSVVKPGDAEHSYLYLTTTRQEDGFEMPPKEADQLTQEQQWIIRDWINEGAPWPSPERILLIQEEYAEGQTVSVSKALSDEWQNRRYESEKLWAYRPISKPAVPTGNHPIDWFINRKLQDSGVQPAASAAPDRLLRRMSFGLTGLPPTPEQRANFQKQFAEAPAAAILDEATRLMSSPHYGEHFGWHWLDVVRYADTAGFANDYSRPNAWRYRDYVVRAFNDDKPYNQFVKEQIAGDELDPSRVENLIATGFLRMGPWEQTSMSVFRETRGQWLDDVTDTVGQTFLAHSMLCCKCHDHKFDPVPTRDYYSMRAVFSTTQFAGREAPFLEQENQNGFSASDAWVKAKIAAYDRQWKELGGRMQKQKSQETGEAKVGDNGLNPGDEASFARMQKNMSRHRLELDKTRPFAFSVYTGATVTKKNVQGRQALPKNPWVKGAIEKDAIHNGGDVYSLGDPVTPGALSAAESLGEMKLINFPDGKGKRRTALANWIVHPSNPLTPRVIVNRIWSWHFGKGLAANPNNFGATGGLPTHPELLDYLAAWFVENDWSIKKLNHLIISSDAYQRSTRHPQPDQLQKQDPLHQLYATFQSRRLTAEEIRDAMLLVSGELNPTVGGIPCRPDINPEVALQPRQIMGGTASVYEPDPLPSQRNRRSLYAERIRGVRDPFLETFNQPGPDKSCELRETSIVAPQALTLLNSAEVYERAIAFADRLKKEQQPGKEAIIQRAFQISLSRLPKPHEIEACLRHWEEAAEQESEREYKPAEFPVKVSRTVMAEKTGQPYTFVEFMPAFESYEPDLQPSDVDADTRGLAAVCRVLLNTNEFVYLD